MKKKRLEILDAVHETATGLLRAGVLEQDTMREFDRLCRRQSDQNSQSSDQVDSRPTAGGTNSGSGPKISAG